MLNRLIYNYLDDFYKKSRKVLLITGARQVGKTFSIRYFGHTHFDCFVELNFAENPQAARTIAQASNSEDLLMRLSLLSSRPLVEGNTLFFFDEVQECPEIVTAIKFLVEDGRYRYIMSGSLLGVDFHNIRSLPVGYMTIKQMYPLDFREFVQAMGVRSDIISRLEQCWENQTEVDPYLHDRMMQIFKLYLIVGGMPAAVQAYLDTHDLQQVMGIQRDITELYKKDIAKYDPHHKLYIEEIYDLIAPELNAKNKRFVLKRLNENVKFSRLENSFLWLKDAGVALPVYNIEEPKVPLILSRSRNLFKLFLCDVGLLASSYADGIQFRILNDDKNVNHGAVYENFIAQELTAHGFALYYFNSKKQGELDFTIEQDGHVVPIEVKSGKDYERHRALLNVLSNPEYDIERGIVFCNGNVHTKMSVVYMPIYMVMFLHKHNDGPLHYTLDIDMLR